LTAKSGESRKILRKFESKMGNNPVGKKVNTLKSKYLGIYLTHRITHEASPVDDGSASEVSRTTRAQVLTYPCYIPFAGWT